MGLFYTKATKETKVFVVRLVRPGAFCHSSRQESGLGGNRQPRHVNASRGTAPQLRETP